MSKHGFNYNFWWIQSLMAVFWPLQFSHSARAACIVYSAVSVRHLHRVWFCRAFWHPFSCMACYFTLKYLFFWAAFNIKDASNMPGSVRVRVRVCMHTCAYPWAQDGKCVRRWMRVCRCAEARGAVQQHRCARSCTRTQPASLCSRERCSLSRRQSPWCCGGGEGLGSRWH